MIRDLGREKDLPPGVYPDLVGGDELCGWGEEDRHRQALKWRRRLIAELKRRPDWIAEWRAAAEIDRQVRELCTAKGLRFMPWECPPWRIRVDDELPGPGSSFDSWAASVPLAQKLRRQLETELRAKNARKPAENLGRGRLSGR